MCDSGMKQLSDSLLIQSYHKAIELNLSEEFIDQIKKEINHRSIQHLLEKHISHVG
ncbi:developmental checkpoint coupling sporulation initiation to replication initiation [Halobacillus karajensis]|uniref:Histidine kinase KinA inhibitor n=2 Tax=Halobacillus karajensis TaxID=195088 RepID=A0A024P6L1_9BACI|nr:Histidine kinase KinA inhibitor [Halobacillus karajensis]CDQ24423.1 Histidine kinase KinA inhibitor [Halobacillus karajensis]CDQ29329.1 Histidine kinase KinA inhibitor [Halobacillus karajensis]SEH59811.1 developmental checkpoint coupling sporulation initiation to replication initiation [Halobacillus karajensis]